MVIVNLARLDMDALVATFQLWTSLSFVVVLVKLLQQMPQHVFGTASQAALQANGGVVALVLTGLIAILVLLVPFAPVVQLCLLAALLIKDQILEQLLVLYRQRVMQAIICQMDAAHYVQQVTLVVEEVLHHPFVLFILSQLTLQESQPQLYTLDSAPLTNLITMHMTLR